MNDKAQIAMRAIDKVMASITDKETRDHLQKARNFVELLGAQCDRAEERRAYWVRESTKLMRRIDAMRNERPTVVYIGQDLPKPAARNTVGTMK